VGTGATGQVGERSTRMGCRAGGRGRRMRTVGRLELGTSYPCGESTACNSEDWRQVVFLCSRIFIVRVRVEHSSVTDPLAHIGLVKRHLHFFFLPNLRKPITGCHQQQLSTCLKLFICGVCPCQHGPGNVSKLHGTPSAFLSFHHRANP